jgi:hypothetical protein
MAARKSVLVAAAAAAVLAALLLPGRAAAHGDCSQGKWIEHKTNFHSEYNLPYTSKVRGIIRFLCEGNEQHHKIFVHIRLYKCYRTAFYCEPPGTLTLVAGVTKYCYDTTYCIRATGWTTCQSHYLFIAYARWAAWYRDGTLAHHNPGWPNFNEEQPNITGYPGTSC